MAVLVVHVTKMLLFPVSLSTVKEFCQCYNVCKPFKFLQKGRDFFVFLFLTLSVVCGKRQALAANFGFDMLVWFEACT